MPELPEVETVRRQLLPSIQGRTIRRVEILREDFVESGLELVPKLRGAKCLDLWRRGKFLFLETGAGVTAMLHLGMTGRLTLAPSKETAPRHTHAIWRFSGGGDVMRHYDPRRFGRMAFYRTERLAEDSPLGRLGVDALSVTKVQFRSLLTGRARMLKALLLDQGVIAGLGNIYIDEALYGAEIHPRTSSCLLSREHCDALWRCMRRVLRDSIRAGGSSIDDYRWPDGRPGWYQIRHRVYARKGEPCRRRGCGGTILAEQIAGRTTHYCPRCQPRLA